MQQNEKLLAYFGFNTAENEPSKVCYKGQTFTMKTIADVQSVLVNEEENYQIGSPVDQANARLVPILPQVQRLLEGRQAAELPELLDGAAPQGHAEGVQGGELHLF